MQNIDMLTVNDSEGLLQSPKRHNMTGANTYVLLSPQTTCTDLEKQFSKRDYTYTLYGEAYTVIASSMGARLKQQGASYLGLVTGIIGTLILLVGLINFFHFLIGSFFNRTKEYSIMKMIGCNWKTTFLFTIHTVIDRHIHILHTGIIRHRIIGESHEFLFAGLCNDLYL